MKRKIICYIFLVSVFINLFSTHATRGRKKISLPQTEQTNSTHKTQGGKYHNSRKHTQRALSVPTCQEILSSAYVRVVFERALSHKNMVKPKNPVSKRLRKKLSEPGNVELLGQYMPQKALRQMEQAPQYQSPIQLGAALQIKPSAEVSDTPQDEPEMVPDTGPKDDSDIIVSANPRVEPETDIGIEQSVSRPTVSEDNPNEKPQIDFEPSDTAKIRNVYRHDAYTSLRKFKDRWNEFSIYFEKLIRSTHFVKYFSPASQLSTQSINDTIREFMTPSEYLNEVERIFLSEDTFNSQIASEIISKKLSELGFENYILQLIPGEFEYSGAPANVNKSSWVVLYRGGLNNWYVVDFSLAMKHKFDTSVPPATATMVPFYRYMEKLLNLASNQDEEWFVTVGGHRLRNAVMINFTPGFMKKVMIITWMKFLIYLLIILFPLNLK